MGGSFIEEGQVDSWMEWASLEVDHLTLDPACDVSLICETLEAALKTRTFLVGQRFTLADLSAACSLRQSLEKAGLDTLRSTYPNAIRWFQTCTHHPALADAKSPQAAPAAKAAAKSQPAKETKSAPEKKETAKASNA